MINGYYRPISIFLAILFLFASVVARSQSGLQSERHSQDVTVKHVTDPAVTNSTQILIEEKEGKDADSVTGSFTLIYLIRPISLPLKEATQRNHAPIKSDLFPSVPRFIAIRSLLI